jgi:hypothetical protein
MVLTLVADLGIKICWYAGSGLYRLGYRLIYGPTKSRDELLVEALKSIQEKDLRLAQVLLELEEMKERKNIKNNLLIE